MPLSRIDPASTRCASDAAARTAGRKPIDATMAKKRDVNVHARAQAFLFVFHRENDNRLLSNYPLTTHGAPAHLPAAPRPRLRS